MQEFLVGVLAFLVSLFGGGGQASETTEIGSPQDTAVEVRVYPREVYGDVVRVLDGDTIDVMIDGTRERVRYIGIDTPEEYEEEEPECFSEEASKANSALVEDERVRLVADKVRRDNYGRLLHYVYVNDTFVNQQLLQDGYAKLLFIPPNTEHYGEFKAIRDEARAQGRGLWSACAT